jgi:type IV secretion system protein VirB9
MARQLLLLLLGLSPAYEAHAGQTPKPGVHDARIRYVNYSADDVTIIHVQRGTATRIILAPDEKILHDGSATGFAGDCAQAEADWCIRADAGENKILVKPKDGATHNNLELRTDRRDYSFVFAVLPDATRKGNLARMSDHPMFRVVFRYPTDLLKTSYATDYRTRKVFLSSELGNSAASAALPTPRNWHYSMQVKKGSGDIAPGLVFDDGRFTYFQFPANREIPAIFYVSPAGEEARVNFHMDDADESLVVVERIGRRFVLRLGNATVGVWNDNFDANGVPPKDGTTVNGLIRGLREGASHE